MGSRRRCVRESVRGTNGLVASQCKVIGVKGESMEPTLTDGCSILIDLNRRRRTAGHLYVIRTGDGLIVKRAGKNRAGAWQLVRLEFPILSLHPGLRPRCVAVLACP